MDYNEVAGHLRKTFGIKIQGNLNLPMPILSFEALLLSYNTPKKTLQLFRENGWILPTPIQRQVIPAILSNNDILAIAPTGSGKTLSFLLPIMLGIRHESIYDTFNSYLGSVRAVLLSPTREIAGQTNTIATALGISLRVNVKIASKAHFSAGVNLNNYSVIIATPRRLVSFIDNNKIEVGFSRYLVIDEVDFLFGEENIIFIDYLIENCRGKMENSKSRNFKHGKKQPVNIATRCIVNKDTIRCLFSATFPEKIEELAKTILNQPTRITVGNRNKVVGAVEQNLLFVGKETGKHFTLCQLIKNGILKAPIIVFVNSKNRAQALHRKLLCDAIPVDSIHAYQSQSIRNNTINRFELGKIWVLIASDLISRGMDIGRVESVVNFDLPKSISNYVHRVGRAGRCGRHGFAVTFFTENDFPSVKPFATIIRESGGSVAEWILEIGKNISAQQRK